MDGVAANCFHGYRCGYRGHFIRYHMIEPTTEPTRVKTIADQRSVNRNQSDFITIGGTVGMASSSADGPSVIPANRRASSNRRVARMSILNRVDGRDRKPPYMRGSIGAGVAICRGRPAARADHIMSAA